MWIILVAIVTVLFLYWIWIRNKHDHIPGPRQWPIVGNTFQINTRKVHFTLENWTKEFGPIFKCSIFGSDIIVLSSPDLIRQAYASEEYFKNCSDRPDTFLRKYCLGGMLFLMDYGKSWRNARKAFRNALHIYGAGVAKFENTIQEEIVDFIEKIRQTKGNDFDPAPLIERSGGNLVSILVVGEPMSDSDAKVAWDFAFILNEVLSPVVETSLYNFPFLRFVPGKFRRIYIELQRRTDALLNRYLRPYQATYQPGIERGIVDAFIKLQKETQEKGETWFNDKQMEGLICDVMIGALLSTVGALMSVFLTLVNNIPCQERIYKEITAVIGKHRLPCLDDKTKMPFTQAVIMESFRLSNFLPTPFPRNVKEDIEFGGYKIPKNTRILPNRWWVHQDPNVWGDPEIFRPERFLDADGNLLPVEHKLQQAWLFFGVGRRNCPGEVLSKSRMFLYVASFCQAFRILPPKESPLIKLDSRNFISGLVARPPAFTCTIEERA